MFKTAFCLALCGFTAVALAQDTSGGPRHVTASKLSPAESTSMELGGKRVLIQYSAPSARDYKTPANGDRKVEGGLIPYDHWWRLGANEATTLDTDADIMIGDLKVPKGVYTLYLIATSNSDWKLAVNKQTGQWGTEYNPGQDLGRVPMHVHKTGSMIETLKIELTSHGSDSGTLTIEWGHSRATVPVKLS
jgi:Protein of unknown function (DUF2911)